MTVHDSASLMGVPPSLWGTQCTVYPLLPAVDSSRPQSNKALGPVIASLPKTFVFHSFFSCQLNDTVCRSAGRPRGSLAGCGGAERMAWQQGVHESKAQGYFTLSVMPLRDSWSSPTSNPSCFSF